MPWVIYGILKFKSNLVRAILVIVGILIGMGIVFFVIDFNGMAASLFAPQDVLIYQNFITKPYTKFPSVFLGVAMALIYTSI